MPVNAKLQLGEEIDVASRRYLVVRRRLLQIGLLFSLAYWVLVGWSFQQSWLRNLEHSQENALQAAARVTDRINLSLDLAEAVFATTDIALEQVPDPYTISLILKPMAVATLHVFDSVVIVDQQKERQLATREGSDGLAAGALAGCPPPAAELPLGKIMLSAGDEMLALIYKPKHGWSDSLSLCSKLRVSQLNGFLQETVASTGLQIAILDLASDKLISTSGGLILDSVELDFIRKQAAPEVAAPRWLALQGAGWLDNRRMLMSRIDSFPVAIIVQVSNRELVSSLFEQVKWLFLLSVVLMGLLLVAYIASLRYVRALDFAATHDGLTHLYNRRHIIEMTLQVQAMAKRLHQSYSVVLVDVDHFKQVNDTYGHTVGDEVLQGIASVLGQAGRKSDLVGRYGGEEFIMVLPGTDTAGATLAAERLRSAVASRSFSSGEQVIPITISLGFICDDGSRRLEDLLNAADLALYKAKQSGRNCAVQASALS